MLPFCVLQFWCFARNSLFEKFGIHIHTMNFREGLLVFSTIIWSFLYFQGHTLSCLKEDLLYLEDMSNLPRSYNETVQVSQRLHCIALLTSYESQKFQKIVLPNARHVSLLKQERVMLQYPLSVPKIVNVRLHLNSLVVM